MDKNEFYEEVQKAEGNGLLVQEMQQSEYPFVIWGIGSLSYSIKKYLDYYHIKVSSYWVDGNPGLKERDGIPVQFLSAIENQFDKFNVVFGHSKYELKTEIKKRCKNIQNIFCIPNVCYGQYQKMEKAFFEKNKEGYYRNFSLLEDRESQECMIAYLKCKITEKIDYIVDIYSGEGTNYFTNPVYKAGEEEVYIDVGAYTGDSLELFLKSVNNHYKKIYAFEPEEKSFQLLKEYVEEKKLENIVLEKKGTWNKKDTLSFSDTEESSSIDSMSKSGEDTKIAVDTLDSMLNGETVTLVKINFLVGVKETIEGMKGIMVQSKPKLAVTVGFDEYALLSIPMLIKAINPAYKIYLRFADAMPARLLLLAV